MGTTDEKIKSLFVLLEKKRNEIKKIERPTWITNCSFSYSADRGNAINIHVVSDEAQLIDMLAFLMHKEEYTYKAMDELGITRTQFKWNGYKGAEWREDIAMRINILNINKKKASLAAMEEKLNSLVSPEEKRRMEVEAMAALLLEEE